MELETAVKIAKGLAEELQRHCTIFNWQIDYTVQYDNIILFKLKTQIQNGMGIDKRNIKGIEFSFYAIENYGKSEGVMIYFTRLTLQEAINKLTF